MLLDQVGEAAAAEGALRRAVAILRPLAESLTTEPKYARNLAIACNNLSFVLRKRDTAEAESVAREAIAILEPLAERHPNQVQYQDDLALCYNNLAALESHQRRLDEAIDWHDRAIALQERLVRKAPAVVRHRSDLAISFNNLGVAYCRANRGSDADDAFARARGLLATLADDYPDELAYRSSLAALLNNQALALSEAGRHEDALEIYGTAVESQRNCFARSPKSVMFRELLSKIYYNYRQALQALGRVDEAAETALARRELWQGDGPRLFGVAVELAEIGREADSALRGPRDPTVLRGSPNPARAEQIDVGREIIATLQQVQESGWPPEIDLATDKRFDYLHGQAAFEALVAELKGERGGPPPVAGDEEPQS
jgi:tetratricopeptide (TPR) repeat protein